MIRVLIVEDEPRVRRHLRQRLELEPDLAVVGEAADADEALAAMAAEPVDVVVLDVVLPGCGGLDLAEQGCKSLETNLRDFADERFGEPGLQNAIARSAVNKIADHVKTHQADCMTEFVSNTGVGPTPPSCDTGPEYDELLETGQWSFDPEGLVSRVTISVASASHDGVYPMADMPETCMSADDNDGVLFFQIDPKQRSTWLTLASGAAVLHGPRLDVFGVAELESMVTGCATERCSRLALAVDRAEGSASLEELQLRLAGTADVGDPSATLTVDAFTVRLWDATQAALDREGTMATIPPGGAWFVISATASEARGVLSATNETTIVLREEAGGWTSSAFTIAHRDPLGGRWALIVMPARWE